jgi:hypothetical protein
MQHGGVDFFHPRQGFSRERRGERFGAGGQLQ